MRFFLFQYLDTLVSLFRGINFYSHFQVSPAVSCKNHYSAGLTSSGNYYLKVSGQSFQVRKFIKLGIFLRLMLSVDFVKKRLPVFQRYIYQTMKSKKIIERKLAVGSKELCGEARKRTCLTFSTKNDGKNSVVKLLSSY